VARNRVREFGVTRSTICILACFGIYPSAALAESPWLENRASDSALPQGEGFAATFSFDHGIAESPHVIFSDDFESGSLESVWDSVRNGDTVLSLQGPGAGPVGERSLRVEARLGRDTGGGVTQWFEPTEVVFVRFYTRFDASCDYVHHFVTLRANRGSSGAEKWSGFGGAGNKPDGRDRFSTALEPWGNWGRYPAPGRWNFYSYWSEMSAAPDGNFWGNSFRPDNTSNIPKSKWICCEFMLKENTPGKRDGEQAFWIDGVLLGHWKGFNWRDSEELRANALTLESYVTDRWTDNPINIVWFDNVVIAKQYIGPVGE